MFHPGKTVRDRLIATNYQQQVQALMPTPGSPAVSFPTSKWEEIEEWTDNQGLTNLIIVVNYGSYQLWGTAPQLHALDLFLSMVYNASMKYAFRSRAEVEEMIDWATHRLRCYLAGDDIEQGFEW